MVDMKAFWDSSKKTIWLILKLVIPFYILADVLFYFDLIKHLLFLFEPITALLHLPPEATLSLITGMLFNLYPAIAFAAPLDLSAYEWTVLGIFLGVNHALIVETLILKKLGVNIAYTLFIRFSVGLVAAASLQFLPKSWFSGTSLNHTEALPQFPGFSEMITHSIKEALFLAIEIVVLVVAILFILELIKQSAWLKHKQEKVSMSFSLLTGSILGVTYGAGVLINESQSGNMSKRDLFYITTFLMIFHAIIEDTLLFVIFGANAWLMVSIRLMLALVVGYLALIVYKYKT